MKTGKRKSFCSELRYENLRRGCAATLWGALISHDASLFLAVVPVSPGHYRHKVVGGPFATAELASEFALAALRREDPSSCHHLDGTGQMCFCKRGALLTGVTHV